MSTRRAAWYVPELNPRRSNLRYRCMYPLLELQRQGHAVEVWDGRDQARADQYDVVVFDAWELFPSIGGEASAARVLELARALKAAGKTIVLDNCDNQFAGGAGDAAWQAGCERLVELVALTDHLVVCSNDLAQVMRACCSFQGPISVIGDPVEVSIRFPGDTLLRRSLSWRRKQSWLRYWQHRRAITADRRAGRTPLVWFGSHGNSFAEGGMLELLAVRESLEALHRDHPLSLSVISNHPAKFAQHFSDWAVPVHYLDWDRVSFLAALRLHDISLIPSRLNDFTRCKSANRLVLSLHHGLAVVADAVPSYREFESVSRLEHLHQGLHDYLANPSLRNDHLRVAHKMIEERYSHRVIGACWGRVLFGGAGS